jgi:glycosyltransferase involved in cell wall biosynthesis
VTQIAYNFSVPMVVTRVGGLPEIVTDGKVGIVCEPTVDGIADAIERLYSGDVLAHFAENFPEERKRFSWSAMCDRLEEVYQMTK